MDKVRLTGGEPLLRRNLPDLVGSLAADRRLKDLALTTNGVLLAEQAEPLRAAGLMRVTVSLDTLHADRFTALTRLTSHARVLEGIEVSAGLFDTIKIDSVVMRGVNDDELVPLLEYARARRAEVRFIEYMDVGGATQWSPEKVMSGAAILERIEAHYGPTEPIGETTWAPADRYRLPDGSVFGLIASTTSPFCSTCDRARLTADGVWLTVPLRDRRHQPPRAAAGGRLARRTGGARRRRLARAERPGRGAAGGRTAARHLHPGGCAQRESTSRNAHAGRVDRPPRLNRGTRCSARPAPDLS